MTMVRCQVSLRRFLSAAAIMILMSCAAVYPAWSDDLGANKSELIRGVLPTVVNISVKKDEMPSASSPPASVSATTSSDPSSYIKAYVGSGFVIDPSGVIVTNYHVVQDAFEITVTFFDGSRLSGKMMSASRLADLALVKVNTDHPLQAAHWGNSNALQVGDQVFAAGNPFGIGLSVSAGIVSGLNRDIQNSPYDDLIQTDATINHGNSGGPLFDMQGRVIGVNSTIISPTSGSSGLGFAIPASSAHFVVDQLRAYGWVRPGWIGIKVQTVTREMADAMGMARAEGSLVAWVLTNGPAKKAGLVIGDVILKSDGMALSDERALLRDIAHTDPGKTISLTVLRDGDERNVPVQVETWPRNQWDARDAPLLVQRPKLVIPADLGLSYATIPNDQKSQLGLQEGLDGVLVTTVSPNSDAAHRGMSNGDIILRVQDKPVTKPADVQSLIDATRAENRDYVLMLVLPKTRDVIGPKWIALQVNTKDG